MYVGMGTSKRYKFMYGRNDVSIYLMQGSEDGAERVRLRFKCSRRLLLLLLLLSDELQLRSRQTTNIALGMREGLLYSLEAA